MIQIQGANVIKLFFLRNLRRIQISSNVFLWHAFRAMSIVYRQGHEPTLVRYSPLGQALSLDLTSDHKTRPERPARNKHSILLDPFVSYEQKVLKHWPQIRNHNLFKNYYLGRGTLQNCAQQRPVLENNYIKLPKLSNFQQL